MVAGADSELEHFEESVVFRVSCGDVDGVGGIAYPLEVNDAAFVSD